MQTRLNLHGTDLAPKFGKYLVSANKVVADSTLPAATQELVKIRASQINGCGGCLDMHTKEAARGRDIGTAQPDRGMAGHLGLHRPGAGRAGTHGAGHPPRRRQWRHRRGMGERGQTLRRGAARGPGVPDRRHQRLQPAQCHHPTARGRLPARAVRVTGADPIQVASGEPGRTWARLTAAHRLLAAPTP